jgi:hypothetical protein
MNKSVEVGNAWCIGACTDAEAKENGLYDVSKFVCNVNSATRLLDYYYGKIDG